MSLQRLRIIVGQKLLRQYSCSHDLKVLYQSKDFLIQGTSTVDIIQNGNQVCALFCGQVTGLKNKTGQMIHINKTQTCFKEFIKDASVNDCFQHLEGRYVLVLLDVAGNCQITCDRFGQMDLYYQRTEDGAVFATDLSLLSFKDSTVVFDPASVAHSLYVYGFRPPKRHTLYKGIKRLGVGEIALWNKGQLEFHEISPMIVPTREYGKKDLGKYSEILMDAVAQRSSPNGNVVYLSSGWDSTALLALLVKLHGPKKVRGVIGRLNFSKRAGVNNPFEIERAQKVADYFKIKLEVVDSDWSSIGPDLLERWRPFMRSHMVTGMSFFNWANLAEHVAKTTEGNEALFSGEISDGAHNLGFSQFTTLFHPMLEFREYSDKMASYLFGPAFYSSLQKGIYKEDAVYNLLKQKFSGSVFDEPSADPAICARQLFSSFFLRNTRFPLFSIKNNKMFTEEGRERYEQEMGEFYLDRPAMQAKPETLYSWFLHLYNSFHWQGGTVATLALTAEACGLEMNLPFWDSRLQEFLSAMPESWGRGLDLKPTKYPLKWMLENCIDYPLHLQIGPHSYLYDVNPNFNHAGEFIYSSQFAPLIKQSMSKRLYRELLSPEFFDHSYFDKISNNYLNGNEVIPERSDLSALAFLSLSSWYGN